MTPTTILWNGEIFPLSQLITDNAGDDAVTGQLSQLQFGQTLQFGGGSAPLMTIQAPSFVYHTLTVFLPDQYRVKAYRGRAQKPFAFYRFPTEAARDLYVERIKAEEDVRQSQRNAKQAVNNEFQVGDILHYSWGFEQTNCDFFQVVGLTPRGVKIRPIESSRVTNTGNDMSGKFMPVPDHFTGPVLLKRLFKSNSVLMDHGTAVKWDGHRKFASWYA